MKTQAQPSESKNANPQDYELYILRHGPAGIRDATKYPDDNERPLTNDGRKRVREAAEGLKSIGVELDWIVSSPLARAAETAKIVEESLDQVVPLDFSDSLGPGGTPESLLAFLAKQPARRRVMLVGHEPDLSEIAGRLMGARRANLVLKKGGCCLIRFSEFPPGSAGELVWWLTPRILRRLK